MRDFTLTAYKNYILSLRQQNYEFLLFRDFIPAQNQSCHFCLLRHDVDRNPENALRMAELEYSLRVRSTYYFRYKSKVFIPEIMKKIEEFGHEVGYHYENLSDTNGNYTLALDDFEDILISFRRYVNVKTISMHGRPLKQFDNRDLWRQKENRYLLKSKFEIIGEVYLDIDYSNIAYINDTGRNWSSTLSNHRDRVESNIPADFENGNDLLNYFRNNPHKKLCFQIHPERWHEPYGSWLIQYCKDSLTNATKEAIRLINR